MQNSLLAIQRQRELLKMEYEAEKKEFLLHTEKMGIRRNVRRGLCWFPISVGRSYYNSLNRLVVEITQNMPNDNEHQFEYGKPVRFFSVDEKDEIRFFTHPCQVSYVDKDRMAVCVKSAKTVMDIQSAARLGVQLFFDETSYNTMFHALDEVLKAKNNRLEYFRDLFAGQLRPQKFTFRPIRFPWLNPTQEYAVNEVLRAKDVAVVHGPPGTGKTTTLVEAIYETLMRETQVMVCAQSNMAVDWISERLVDRGIEVLRVGNPTRVNDKMLSFTYERRFEAHPSYTDLWAMRKAMRELQAKRSRRGTGWHDQMDRLKSRATELELRINADIFNHARVIACTLAGSASRVLQGMKFGTLFIDEAAQALEAACWIAMSRARRVVLAGDHCQLPPTVKSYEAMRAGLGVTLMERIVKNQPGVVSLLELQYRMNDAIVSFSSRWFYHGRVKSAAQVGNRGILDLDTPMVWVDTSDRDFKETMVGETYGRVNRDEALLTLQVLQNYFERLGVRRVIDERIDVGIISPYRAQVQLLRQLLRGTAFFKPLRHLITVNTVDGFQGQERDVIVISLVRANDQGQIGFLSDLRRMNVAITRARSKVMILGDSGTMTRHRFYRELYEYIDQLKNDHTMKRKIVFATNNAHKLQELRQIVGNAFEILSLADIDCHDDIPETGATIEENAALKALWVKERYGYDCFSDDTGLEIDALDGEPGVKSARYAGGDGHDSKANMAKVLAKLEGVPFDRRTARFRTAICLIMGEQVRQFQGKVEGHILAECHGADGFGYDPIFAPVEAQEPGTTFAQMTPDEKNAISHRGRAVRQLVQHLLEQY